MIAKLLATDFLKIKRKGLWFLTVLGPFGVVLLQWFNYELVPGRREWLLQRSDDDWLFYLHNVNSFTPPALVLGITILTSLSVSIENETNAWKQLVALPVSKMGVFLAKFTVLAFLLAVASVLLFFFTLLLGIYLDLGSAIPYVEIAKFSFYPYFASFPLLALHLWVATISNNQGIPISLGVVGFLFATYSFKLPDWLPWKWPSLQNQWDEPLVNVALGICVGIVLYIAGMLDFARRDVK
ncbi:MULTISPECIES: ABC transporter permease [Parageobacillus]|uniref:Permease n=1 Tax=Parageobacillus galactosidasius TaxID=883812 RepID=A0A226QRY1_9BACL|nr:MULTISPECIES: ABC transporter permease [Parageobacillus]MED4991011.1 ABC transporter permease [Parageobacillus toebii]OQP00277.1 permease [Geobacillus sp. 44C]OXB94272.1 permease [Parageobacillus galactosidasius]QNU33811.1 ABC transporter permease [Geobacillus sp. 44C]